MQPKSPGVDINARAPVAPLGPVSGQTTNQSSANSPRLNQKSSSKTTASHGPALMIIITVIVMVLLIGLAYLAYSKSK